MSVHGVDELCEVLARGAELDDGEPVDLLAHALQCAAILALVAPDDRELQIAGLVHDIGSVLEPDQPTTHATTGAALVEPLLGARVAWLVANHANAKRYLVAIDPGYRDHLSPRSRETLDAQGGPLDDDAVTTLWRAPDLGALLTLRAADDDAKVPGRVVPDLERWRSRLAAFVEHPR